MRPLPHIMEVVILLCLIVLIIMVVSYQSGSKSAVNRLTETIDILIQETIKLKKEVKDLKERQQDKSPESRWAPPAAPEEKEAEKPAPPLGEEQPVIIPEPMPELRKQPAETMPVFTNPGPRRQEPVAPPVQPKAPETYEPREGWWDRWLRNNPDLEKFIGENLINKIGIAILVLGIAFFVKYAIDKDWINEVGRVCIGLGAGALLAGLAHYLRNSYRSFSSVLAGGGLAVFYFTIAFAFHQYHLMSQTAAFVIMVVITGFAVALALLYDKLELAVIAAAGGFITPFLVSTGEGNYIVLFTYLIILNIGLLALSWFKRWPLINIISLFFTEIIFGGWMIRTLMQNEAIFPYPQALAFATMFYIIFLGMNMLHQLRTQKPFRAFDFSILLLITFSYYSAGMILLKHVHSADYQGLFTALMAVLNLGLAWFFFKRENTDRNLLYLLIGLTLTFITLAAPVQLHGHAITMFWSAEMVLLFWLSQRSGIRLFRYTSLLIMTLTIVSLLMDWQQAAAQPGHYLTIIFTGVRGIVTNVIAIAAFILYYFLLKKEEATAEFLPGIRMRPARTAMLVIGLLIAYLSCIYGVNLAFGNEHTYTLPNVYHRLILAIFALGMILYTRYCSPKMRTALHLSLIALCFLTWLGSSMLILSLRDGIAAGSYPVVHVLFHWLNDLLLLYLAYHGIQLLRRSDSPVRHFLPAFTWAYSVLLVTFFSMECLHIYVLAGYYNNNTALLTQHYQKAGLTVLWAACSFAMMWLGMRHRYKPIRIVSLVLFSIALLKLFLFDIRRISETGKIVAFILLGVLLLVISFMYQKLKKIIIDDHKE